MKTELPGCTGVTVSELCFGTISFGGDAILPPSPPATDRLEQPKS